MRAPDRYNPLTAIPRSLPRRVPAILFLLLAGGPLFVRAQEETKAPRAGELMEHDEDAAWAIRQRVLLYLQKHGDNGRIDPERRRQRVADEYARFREEEKRRGPIGKLSIGGNQWISLGPTNGAGRMTGISFHPTDTNTVYVGAADGGLWRTTDAGSSWTPLTEGLNDLAVGAVAVGDRKSVV